MKSEVTEKERLKNDRTIVKSPRAFSMVYTMAARSTEHNKHSYSGNRP